MELEQQNERRGPTRPITEAGRNEAERDYGRIVHSASFRRLQGKTQILNLGDSDFYRTRLTHTLEVAQVATGLLRQKLERDKDQAWHKFLPTVERIQAISLTHDLGHPPFGHGGEVALNYCMRKNGGFEGNAQTLRILTSLEKYSENAGADLTRRTLLGSLKYPVSFNKAFNRTFGGCDGRQSSAGVLIDRKFYTPPKSYFDCDSEHVDWILEPFNQADRDLFTVANRVSDKHNKPQFKSLDCTIMDLADDIAYGVHDLEDSVALKLVVIDEFKTHLGEQRFQGFLEAEQAREYPKFTQYDEMVDHLFAEPHKRKSAIGALVHYFIEQAEIQVRNIFRSPLLDYQLILPATPRAELDALKDFVKDQVIFTPEVQHLEFKGQQMVIAVFEALKDDPQSLLPRSTFKLFEEKGKDTRVISDHIAGMTDSFLMRTFERLYSPRMGSVFDRLT